MIKEGEKEKSECILLLFSSFDLHAICCVFPHANLKHLQVGKISMNAHHLVTQTEQTSCFYFFHSVFFSFNKTLTAMATNTVSFLHNVMVETISFFFFYVPPIFSSIFLQIIV